MVMDDRPWSFYQVMEKLISESSRKKKRFSEREITEV